MSDRLAAAAGLVLAAAYTWGAGAFETGFIADPIGPKAFPYGIGVLLILFFGVIAVRPSPDSWAGREFSFAAAAFILSLFVYAYALDRLGFIVATALEMTLVVALFRGPLGRGLGLSLLFALALYAIFVFGLALPLPPGDLFGAR